MVNAWLILGSVWLNPGRTSVSNPTEVRKNPCVTLPIFEKTVVCNYRSQLNMVWITVPTFTPTKVCVCNSTEVSKAQCGCGVTPLNRTTIFLGMVQGVAGPLSIGLPLFLGMAKEGGCNSAKVENQCV